LATTTSLVLIQRLSEAIGDYLSLTASGGSTTTVVDTDLDNYTEDDGGIQGWVKIVTDAGGSGAAPEGEIRRIKNGTAGYTQSSTTITVPFAFTAGVVSGDIYTLHRFHPDTKRLAINRAIESLYPLLYLPIRDLSVVIDNRLLNSDFGTFSGGAFTSWTSAGISDLAQESTIIRQTGQKSAKITAGVADGQLHQTPHISHNEMTGKTARAQFWAYATVKDKVRVRLDYDGTNFDNSDYHSGKAQWELLKAEGTVPDAATQIKTICEVAAGETGYFARGYQAVGRIWRYTIPSAIISGPHFLDQQVYEGEPDGDYAPFRAPIEGRILQMRGMGRLSTPTTDSGTTEVDGTRADLIVAKAAEILFSGMVKGGPGNPQQDPAEWRRIRLELEARPGVRMGPMGSRRANGYYTPEEDASGRYIRLKGGRGVAVG
jgi:hypothetical protein